MTKRAELVKLLASANALDVAHAHEVVLRDHDSNDDDPRLVTFIPIGSVLGIAVKRKSAGPVEDADIAFVSLQAFASILGTLGLAFTQGAAIVPRQVSLPSEPTP